MLTSGEHVSSIDTISIGGDFEIVDSSFYSHIGENQSEQIANK